MIKETITVEYMLNKLDGSIEFNFYNVSLDDWENWRECTETFTKFKNNGQVSKTNESRFSEVNRKAEELLSERLAIKASREKDQARAIELKDVIDEAFKAMDDNQDIEWDLLEEGDFDDSKTPGWVTIKTKTSHSSWYQNGGFFNTPSSYYTQVPASVEDEARELQSIRRKHQDDLSFDFYATDYLKREVREADHPNY